MPQRVEISGGSAHTVMETDNARMPGEFLTVAYRCRCGHEWVPKGLRYIERPRMCPRCKSVRWDEPYRPHQAVGSQQRGLR